MLIDRGSLDPFALVAGSWPEFAAKGRHDIEVRHVLSHTSGVSGWEMPFPIDDVHDWDKSTARLAAQPPWWPPRHGVRVSRGHLIGEIVRRITGMSPKEFVRQEMRDH